MGPFKYQTAIAFYRHSCSPEDDEGDSLTFSLAPQFDICVFLNYVLKTVGRLAIKFGAFM